MNPSSTKKNMAATGKTGIVLTNVSTRFEGVLRRYQSSGMLLALGILTILMTYPACLHLNNAVNNGGDPLLNIWIIAQNARHILIGEPFRLFEGNMFYPYRQTLAFSEHLLAITLVNFPILMASTPVVAYNTAVLSSYVLTGYGTYLLALYLTRHRSAALVASLSVAFSPLRITKIGHLQIISFQWMPFAFLFLDKMLRRPNWRNLVLFTLFFNLQALTSYYLAFYLSLACALYVFLFFVLSRKLLTRWTWLCLFAFGLVTLLINLPLSWPYLEVSEKFGFIRQTDEIRAYGAFFLDYLTAEPGNHLWGWSYRWRYLIDPQFDPGEHLLFPGLMTLLLSAVTLIFFTRKSVRVQNKHLVYFISLLFFALIMSLGANDQTHFPEPRLYLPYRWLFENVSIFQSMRVPARFATVVVIMLGILVAYAIKLGLARLRLWGYNKVNSSFIVAIIAIIMLTEACSVPTNIVLLELGQNLPPVYAWLADQNQKKEPLVLELPTWMHSEQAGLIEPKRLFYSIYGWHTLINGYSGFFPRAHQALSKELLCFPNERTVDWLQRFGPDFIIIHQDELSAFEKYNLDTKLAGFSQLSRVDEFDSAQVLRLSGDTAWQALTEAKLYHTLPVSSSMASLTPVSTYFWNPSSERYVFNPTQQWVQHTITWQPTDLPTITNYERTRPPLLLEANEINRTPFELVIPESIGTAGRLTINSTGLAETSFTYRREGQVLYFKRETPLGISQNYELSDRPEHRLNISFEDTIKLIGYDLETEVDYCQPLRLDLYWQSEKVVSDDYTVLIRVIDLQGQTLFAELSEPPLRGIAPTSSWQPNQIIHDTYIFYRDDLKDLPLGTYRLEMHLISPDQAAFPGNLETGTETVSLGQFTLHSLLPPNPQLIDIKTPQAYLLGGKIALRGYDLRLSKKQTDKIDLKLYWQAQSPIEQDYQTFIHIIDGAGNLIAQSDSAPLRGWYPTSRWQVNEILEDTYTLSLPSASLKDNQIKFGLYTLADGQRLAVTDAATGERVADDAININMNEFIREIEFDRKYSEEGLQLSRTLDR